MSTVITINATAKFIALLRNPVERLYSHWYNERCRYNTKLDFEEYLQENDKVRRAVQ